MISKFSKVWNLTVPYYVVFFVIGAVIITPNVIAEEFGTSFYAGVGSVFLGVYYLIRYRIHMRNRYDEDGVDKQSQEGNNE